MKSLLKARDVLCAIKVEPEIGLSALARKLKLPKSTTHRILRALEDAALVTTTAGRYVLGSLIYDLAGGAASRSRMIEVSRLAMTGLRDITDETVALHVLEARGWATISQVESTQELRRTITQFGVPTPLHAGAAGKLFLAYMDEGLRDSYLKQHPLNSYTPATLTNRSRLLEELALIRRRGYSTSVQEVALGVAGMTMPVLGTDGSVKVAVGVSGPMARFTPQAMATIRAELAKTVAEISRLLGSEAGTGRADESELGIAPATPRRSNQLR